MALIAVLPVACSTADAGGEGEVGDSEAPGAATGASTAPASASDGPGTNSSDPSGFTTGQGASDSSTPTTDASGPVTSGPDSNGSEESGDSASTGADVDPVPPGSRVPVGEDGYFLLGANYPWKSYGGDFGGNAWGTYGVHTKPAEYADQFQQMADGGLQVVRWFVFTDGRAGIIFDNSGTPSGLDENVLTDFEAAVGIARDRGVYLVPVLFDFHWMFWGKEEGGVKMGGRSDTITDPIKRAALVDNVVVPLLAAYKDEPAILAWEIMNEPEWALSGLPDGAPSNDANQVPLTDFYALSVAIADAVHANTSAYVTLGSASLKWIKAWTPAFAAAHQLPTLDLDFYQAHYYPWMDGQGFEAHADYGTLKFSPLEQSYAQLELDRPLVIGELVISDNAGTRLDTLLNNGYAGAWPWSLNADYSLDLPGIKGWADAHAELADLPPP